MQVQFENVFGPRCGLASLPALVRFVGPGVQWQSAARLWGLGVLLLFSLVVGSAHKYQSDQYLPFVSQAKLEVSYAIYLSCNKLTDDSRVRS